MANLYVTLKRLMAISETMGDISAVELGEWLDKYDRISIQGNTQDGREFRMTLEVDKEAKKDA